MTRVPQDPAMLLGFVNLKLRDFYSDLEGMCDDLELNADEICKQLAEIDYHYDRERNQFV